MQEPVIVWAGRFSGIMGYSVAAQNYFKALLEMGADVVAFDTDLLQIVGPSRRSILEVKPQSKSCVDIRTTDPDRPLVVVYHERPDFSRRVRAFGLSRLIGYSVFETTSIPYDWRDPMLDMDEIWTASQFNRNSFAASGVPEFLIQVVPHCLDLDAYDPNTPKLEIPGLKETVILSVLSNYNRKDLGLLLRSYYRSFRASDPVSLLIKTTENTLRHFEDVSRDLLAPEFDPDDPSLPHVHYLSATLPQSRMIQLYNTCDIYASPERGKGWDLPSCEVMALGKAVVGIDWSGSTEFMTDDNSFLVQPSSRMEFVDPALVSAKQFYTAQMWPAVDDAAFADQLRKAYDYVDLRRKKGARARDYIRRNLTLELVGDRIMSRVGQFEKHHYRGHQPARVRMWKKPQIPATELEYSTWEQLERTQELSELVLANLQLDPRRSLRKQAAALKKVARHFRNNEKNYLPGASVVKRVKEYREAPKLSIPQKIVRAGAARNAAREFQQDTWALSNPPEGPSREQAGEWAKRRRKAWGRFGPFASPSEEASRLKSLRNRFQGQRIFVMGNGPSLKKIDLSKLAGEYTFGVNKIYMLFDQIDWRPTFYTCLDWEVTPDSAPEINALGDGMTFFFPERFRSMLRTGDDVYWYWSRGPGETLSTQFEPDITRGIPGRGTILVSALQLAFYLGFREIYLIGVDATYKIPKTVVQTGPDRFGNGVKLYLESTEDDDPNHFDPRYFGAGAKWHDPNVVEMKRMFTTMRKGVEVHGGHIYNATPGGALEVFERVDFDSLFDSKPRVVAPPASESVEVG